MKVNVNTCDVEDLLKIPGVGEKTTQKIIKTRGESPFTLHSLSDLLRKDPQEIVEVVTFEGVQKQPDRSHGLSDLKNSMDICDERNAAFSWEETRPKSMSGPTSQLMNDGRPRQRHSMLKTTNVANILLSSRRTNTADISVSIRGLGNFTAVTQEDSTVMTQTSRMMNPGTRGNSSSHPSP
ncbi:general secretion pathway protein k-like protein [Plakobranchus ocellatus]|uniref:General secretion pathway protein k-like protein n=1 Tax=Plakobranchus ocellatus TaxID=259542 RepID=A0AAV4D3S1_9GAST|nr:general secretion pathway protein k-like protein [Plakobranchus ocellatus]